MSTSALRHDGLLTNKKKKSVHKHETQKTMIYITPAATINIDINDIII